jgi:hypothetical protein
MRAAIYQSWVCMVWLIAVSLYACAGHDSHANRSGQRDAAADDSGMSADMLELEMIFADAVAAYDQQNLVRCACFDRAGPYHSVEECAAPLTSGPDWVQCVSNALSAQNSPELREHARCMLEQVKQRTDCLASQECNTDERSACEAIMLPCAAFDPVVDVLIVTACPDTAILARLN